MRKLPDGVCDAANKTHSPLMISEPWLLCSQPLLTLQLKGSPLYSWWGEKELDMFAASCMPGKLVTHSLCSHFSLWEKLQAEGISLGTELWHLWWGVIQIKQCCCSYHLQCVCSQNFAPLMCRDFSAGLLDSHKGTFVCGWLLKYIFCGGEMVENSNSTILLMSVPSVLNFKLSSEFKILFRFCKISFSISLKHHLREVWFVKERL